MVHNVQPPRIFDAHLHIIDHRFPPIPNAGYLPEAFSCADYLGRMGGVDLVGGAVVSGSFQGMDQTYLADALQTLGPRFVGVTQVAVDVSEREVMRLHRLGVRAVRFNLRRGGSEAVRHLEALARRVHALVGWHVELYVDASELEELAPVLGALPAVSIDHLGLSKAGFPTLLRLVARGVRVKASGFGRVDFPVVPALQELFAANPDALMFGTDLPSTRAPRPYHESDLERVLEALGEGAARRVLCDNALHWYRPAEVG